MPQDHPTQWKDVPEQWREDLNPEFEAGDNYGTRGDAAERPLIPASANKQLVDQLPDFAEGELDRIPVLPLGGRLEQGATYLDLADRERGEFTAMGGMVADRGHYYVPKSLVDYVLWNRLLGVKNAERLDQGNISPNASW